MGLFGRRNKPAAEANAGEPLSGNEKHSRRNVMSSKDKRHHKKGAAYGDNALNKKPKFGQWLKVTWPDILTMIIMGVIGLGVRITRTLFEASGN